MSYIFGTGYTRPNRLDRKKDKSYHREYAKYCLGSMGNHTYRRYLDKCLVNWSFFKGGDGQWIFDEDIEAFFLDESGDIRNRLKWTKNVIKPMVQQYVGNAIRLSYDAKAQCISDFVINKREKELADIAAMHKLAEKTPFFADAIKERTGIRDTVEESEEMFYNLFVEEYETDINNLIEYVTTDININELKVQITRPLFFFWDMSAKKPDLTDSEFMGEWYYMDAPSIFENWNHLTKDQRRVIEAYGKNDNKTIHKVVNGIYTQAGGKVPVYEAYWKDVERKEYGWVEDEFGYPFYTLINDPESEYTDKNLIEPQTEKHKSEMGKKKKHKIFVDVLRYCILIPQEEVGGLEGDIVLEYGIVPYQQKNYSDPANVKFPYKCYHWMMLLIHKDF
jgi:hypothetical protein